MMQKGQRSTTSNRPSNLILALNKTRPAPYAYHQLNGEDTTRSPDTVPRLFSTPFPTCAGSPTSLSPSPLLTTIQMARQEESKQIDPLVLNTGLQILSKMILAPQRHLHQQLLSPATTSIFYGKKDHDPWTRAINGAGSSMSLSPSPLRATTRIARQEEPTQFYSLVLNTGLQILSKMILAFQHHLHQPLLSPATTSIFYGKKDHDPWTRVLYHEAPSSPRPGGLFSHPQTHAIDISQTSQGIDKPPTHLAITRKKTSPAPGPSTHPLRKKETRQSTTRRRPNAAGERAADDLGGKYSWIQSKSPSDHAFWQERIHAASLVVGLLAPLPSTFLADGNLAWTRFRNNLCISQRPNAAMDCVDIPLSKCTNSKAVSFSTLYGGIV